MTTTTGVGHHVNPCRCSFVRFSWTSTLELHIHSLFISSRITLRCDSIDFRTGEQKPSRQQRCTLATAEKNRAGITYLFAILFGHGKDEWRRDPATGKTTGNPSISVLVSHYMVALRRRKAHEGEATSSSRAMTTYILSRLHVQNLRDYAVVMVRTVISPIVNGVENLKPRLLQCAYTLSFICLLRIDEVLQIQMQDLTWNKDGSIDLRLPFRKTHQYGKILPFPLWEFEQDEAAICPVRALCEWLQASKIRTGYLFPRLTTNGLQVKNAVGQEPEHMSSEVFLESFRNNLLDIGVDFTPYGTHSFRRGGCQYFVVCRRWNIRRVCEWGGWSTDFTHLTIVKYLISWCDEPMSSRADFLRPGQRVARLCRTCGRSCPCNS
ncbi:DNA breaking-rejoining enzyme [Schizophyllum amplum]|uniref:DNA breaking-rejoining enzyme n=1 Tax=Schizophyllum amplum TaxID=97359 RepID=A0A550BXP5_9AGAR|nr:DNA breaking-rejoining enzyme [Auriculariopsis ampla]